MEYLKSCPNCHSLNIEFLLKTRDFSSDKSQEFAFSKCRNCQMVFLSSRPKEEEIKNYYYDDYQPYLAHYNYLTEAFIKLRTIYEINKFKKLNRKIRDVLEVGCSWGKYLKELRDYGKFKVVGVEISEKMANLGKKEFSLDIRCGDLLKQNFPSAAFDLIAISHVLEHLYCPKETLKEIFRILRPGGLIIIKTPNFETIERKLFKNYWFGYEAPRHLFVFSVNTLLKLLEDNGFKKIKLYFEKTPNNIILSIRNYLIDKNYHKRIIKFFNLNNYPLLFLLAPISFLFAILRISGRIGIIAKKDEKILSSDNKNFN